MKNFLTKLRGGAAFLVAVTLAAVAINSSNPQSAKASGSSPCYDLEFIWARASGSAMAALEYQTFRQEISDALAAAGFTGLYNFYELGTAPDGYPAQKVFEFSLEGVTTTLGAFISAGDNFKYGRSVDVGVQELQNYLNNRLASCPKTYFALGGWSQGAQVIGDTLVTLPATIDTQVLYSVLYGDPKLYLPEGDGRDLETPACWGSQHSPYRAHVPNCQTSAGVLGPRKPYTQQSQRHKVATYCNANDFICGGTINPLDFDDHSSYVADGLYRDGAIRIVKAAKATLPILFQPALGVTSPNAVHPGSDLAIVLDVTGSMNLEPGEYAATLAQIMRLGQQVFDSGGRVALVVYGDTDMTFATGLPSQTLFDFGEAQDVATLYERLRSFTPEQGAGGDDNESLLQGLETALNLSWRQGASKALVVLTDAGFHQPDPTNFWTIQDVQQRSMMIDPVNIFIVKTEPAVGSMGYYNHYEDFEWLDMLAHPTDGWAIDAKKGEEAVEQAFDRIRQRPIARLTNSVYYAQVGQTIHFDASGTTSLNGGLVSASWDMNGDGVFEASTYWDGSGQGIMQFDYQYDQAGEYWVKVRVFDEKYFYSSMSAKVIVVEDVRALNALPRRYGGPHTNASKMVDADGVRYLYVNWVLNPSAVAYHLYINGQRVGKSTGTQGLDGVRIYDLDWQRDITVQLRAVFADGQEGEGNILVILGESEPSEFDWSAAETALANRQTGSGEETDDEPEPKDQDPRENENETEPNIPEPRDDQPAPSETEQEPQVPDDTPSSATDQPTTIPTDTPDRPTPKPSAAEPIPADSSDDLAQLPADLPADLSAVETPDAGRIKDFYQKSHWLTIVLVLLPLAGLIFLCLFWKRRKKEEEQSQSKH